MMKQRYDLLFSTTLVEGRSRPINFTLPNNCPALLVGMTGAIDPGAVAYTPDALQALIQKLTLKAGSFNIVDNSGYQIRGRSVLINQYNQQDITPVIGGGVQDYEIFSRINPIGLQSGQVINGTILFGEDDDVAAGADTLSGTFEVYGWLDDTSIQIPSDSQEATDTVKEFKPTRGAGALVAVLVRIKDAGTPVDDLVSLQLKQGTDTPINITGEVLAADVWPNIIPIFGDARPTGSYVLPIESYPVHENTLVRVECAASRTIEISFLYARDPLGGDLGRAMERYLSGSLAKLTTNPFGGPRRI